MRSRRRRLLSRAGIALVMLALGWRVLSLGLADHFARSDPDRALSWRPNHPGALVEAAEAISGRPPDAQRAAELARAALRANPLEGRGYRVLGQLAESGGDRARAVRLYEIAAQRSPRDLPTQVWLEMHFLRQGQLQPALHHLDLLLRIQPELQERQFPILRALASLPQAQAALVQVLAQNPPWRQAFLLRLCQEPGDGAAIAPFMSRLRLAPGGLSESELSAWLDRLSRDQRWGEAYLTWVATLPADRQAQLGNLYNGGFEHEPSNAGFDWRITEVPGAYIERLPTSGAGGRVALRVSFEDRRVPFNQVRQMLALPAGRYRLEGRGRADGLRSERGLVWSVLCADDNHPVASTEPLMGRSPWRPFAVSFELPAGKCGGQWLQLGVPARIAAEQRIGGQAWFDDLRIVRER